MTKILKPLLASAFLIAAIASAHAQYPDHPIRVISPYPAGSASDTVTRVVLDEVSRLIGQPMVIELKPGAGGATGFATVARSDPDGYTLVTSSSSMATETVLHSKLPYDPVKDFVPVVLLGTSPNILVASEKSGFKTVDDLVKAAKEKPGTITFASAGIGSSSHMAAERFRLAAKIDVRHVPFKEGGLVQVMNGNIDFYFIPLAAASSALHSDKLTILAVSSPKRVPFFPNVALGRRSRLSGRGVPLLERHLGAGKDPARRREETARRHRTGAEGPRRAGKAGEARRRAVADQLRGIREILPGRSRSRRCSWPKTPISNRSTEFFGGGAPRTGGPPPSHSASLEPPQ